MLGGRLIAAPFRALVFLHDCDDEAVLLVAGVGADSYHSSSHGFSQMELLVAIWATTHWSRKTDTWWCKMLNPHIQSLC